MSLEKHKLLIVDDEPALRRALRMSLSGSEFEVSEARSGEEALAALRLQPAGVVLLDINMPGISGFEVCRRIRSSAPQVGVIMVTVRDTEEDKVQALEAGADDFVTKPYRLRELIARLHAVMRRLDAKTQAPEPILRAGALEVDVDRRVATKNGIEIRLSPKEFDLLVYFLRHQGGFSEEEGQGHPLRGTRAHQAVHHLAAGRHRPARDHPQLVRRQDLRAPVSEDLTAKWARWW